ncbi:MAG TPA: hypothetical protein PLP04_02345 [Bryobacteraceae bacterium]|nr:hypothetical protein [Bryobacteraceae bacterium]HPQ14036.1 hypothetical protein [Bryobacteraceae bacterium]
MVVAGFSSRFFGGFVRAQGGVFLASLARKKPLTIIVMCPSCRRTFVSQQPPADGRVLVTVESLMLSRKALT